MVDCIPLCDGGRGPGPYWEDRRWARPGRGGDRPGQTHRRTLGICRVAARQGRASPVAGRTWSGGDGRGSLPASARLGAPPRALPACCAIRAVPPMPWHSSSRSSTGSPKGSTRPTSWRQTLSSILSNSGRRGVCLRRISSVAVCPGEGPLTEPAAALNRASGNRSPCPLSGPQGRYPQLTIVNQS